MNNVTDELLSALIKIGAELENICDAIDCLAEVVDARGKRIAEMLGCVDSQL